MTDSRSKKFISFCVENPYAVLLCVCGFYFYSFVVANRYVHFAYYDWDQALINQSLWDLLHGQLYSSLYGFNVFGDHSTFINVLVLPLFAIFQNPMTISFVEAFLFSASALLFYFMAMRDLDKVSAFFMTCLYLVFPANFFSICHDYNTETLAPFFILLMVYFYREKKVRAFYVTFLFLFLFKENIPLIVAMIGLWGIFAKDRDRVLWGVIPLVLSVVYFLIMLKWVIPFFRGESQYSLWVRYPYLADQSRWSKIFKLIFTYHSSLDYLRQLFGVLRVPAVLSPSVLLLGAPIILYHLLSMHGPEKSIYYYYGALITPAIFLASVQTLKKFRFLRPFCPYICCFLLAFTCYHIFATYRTKMPFKMGIYHVDPIFRHEWEMVKMIPPDAPVVATFKFLPALSMRKEEYSFQKIFDDDYQNPEAYQRNDFYNGKIFTLPENVSYALVDFNDIYIEDYLKAKDFKNRIGEFLKKGVWGVADVRNSVVLFQKGIKDRFPLFRLIDKQTIPAHPLNAVIDNRLALYGYDVQIQQDYIHLILYWKVLQPEPKDVNLFINFVDSHHNLLNRRFLPICYRIWPTQEWQQNQLIEEHDYVGISPVVKERMRSLKIIFCDFKTGSPIPTNSKDLLEAVSLELPK